MFCSERLQTEVQNHLTIFIYGSAKKPDEKKKILGRANRFKFSSLQFASEMAVSTNQLY